MKLLKTLAAATLLATPALAQDEVTLQLQWVTQAQFAGYYVALDQGFYEDENLDVTIQPGGPDIAPPQVLAGGGADVMLNWMPSALAARERGVPVVNIAQPFKTSGLMLTCWADAGIETPEDFPKLSFHIVHPIHPFSDFLQLLLCGAQHPHLVVAAGADVFDDGLKIQQNILVRSHVLGDLID